LGAIQTVIGSVLTLLVYGLVIASVYKVFQIGKDVTEIKSLVSDIKLNMQNRIDASSSDAHTLAGNPQDLLRAIRGTSLNESLEQPPR
jgi:hypothetical protein